MRKIFRPREKLEAQSIEHPSLESVEEETVKRWRDLAAAGIAAREKSILAEVRKASNLEQNQDTNTSDPADTIPPFSTETISLSDEAPKEPTSKGDAVNPNIEENSNKIAPNIDEPRRASQIPPFRPSATSASRPQPPSATDSLSVNGVATRCDFNLIAADEEIQRRFGAQFQFSFGPNTVIEGSFRFDLPVNIDGQVKGSLSSTSIVIVGPNAIVEAPISAKHLIVLGSVHGDIEVQELVELRAGGRFRGTITAKRLVVENGASVHGCCEVPDT